MSVICNNKYDDKLSYILFYSFVAMFINILLSKRSLMSYCHIISN